MLGYLKGNVLEQYENFIILDVNNVGYEIFMCSEIGNIDDLEQSIKIYIYENIKEDINDLYGFLTLSEKKLFKKLILVNGVGPKAAASLILLHGLDLVDYIINADKSALTQVSGIGIKIADRLILELKDKLEEFEFSQRITKIDYNIMDEAINALISLGYKKAQAQKTVNAVYIDQDDLESTIKKSLAILL
ncbi:MAG: Holliday junction DNA helicase RuvA [Candidatus Epulonipiscioides saccharophilum]|nr:MAG: Holliday junction DNA helicase RuvA [Epulopiscium sp. AS2M-Bin001]